MQGLQLGRVQFQPSKRIHGYDDISRRGIRLATMRPLLDRVQNRRLMDMTQITKVVAVLHVQTLLLIHFLRGQLDAHRPAAHGPPSTISPGSYCAGGLGSRP